MNPKYEALFTPFRIGGVEIPNRIVQCSMGGTSLFGWLEPSHFDHEAADFLLQRARDGVGLVLPGMQVIRDTMGRKWLDSNRQMFRVLKPWMEEYHKTGSKLFIQLAGGFGRSMAVNSWMAALGKNDFLNKLASPFLDVQYACASASATPNRWADGLTSRPLTIEEIQEMIWHFGVTARKLREAGVDGVEIHAVHEGYNLDQFAIANMNFRNDQYGGSLENRLRFAAEIIQSIHEQAGDDFPVSLRYSVRSCTRGWRKGAIPCEAFEEFGRDLAESEKAVRILQDAGYAFLNCDNGTYDAWYWAHPPQYMPDNCNLEDVEHIRQFVDIPVACAGRMDPARAAEEIAAGRLDAAAIARQNLADEHWITRIREGREDEIRPCIRCHNGCFNFSKAEGTENMQTLSDSLHIGRCALNPPTMQRSYYKIVPSKNPKKIAVIGGGIGGMESALVLKKRGHQPVIFEKGDQLGGLFLTASAMTFKENDRELLRWYRNEVKRYNIEVRYKTEVKDLDTIRRGFDEIVVCTGSLPRTLPQVKGFEKTMNFTDLLRDGRIADEKLQTVVFFGGGQSSCETAYDMVCNYRKHPIVVECGNDLVAAQATCLANTSFLRDALAYHRVPVYLRSTITEIGDDYCMIKTPEGTYRHDCDAVVNGIGFVPAPVGDKGPHIHRVGDCVAVGNLRTVVWRAWDICMRL